MNCCEVIDLGLCDYDEAYRLQKKLVEEKRRGEFPDQLLLLEHNAVYTFGRKSKEGEKPAPFVEIERGGEATFHNPGQLVGYPILSLQPGERDLHLLLRNFEEVLIRTLSDLGLKAVRKESATGVWLENGKKIASIGIAVSGWVSYHGFALNVENDLSGFTAISPCGFSASVMTSLRQELGEKCPSMEEIKVKITAHFGAVWGRQMIQTSRHDRRTAI